MNLQIFISPEFGQIRTLQLEGETWFIGKDVCEALGYTNSRKALGDHVKENHKTDGVTIRDPIGREQKPIIIDEAGLYSLVMRSKLPQAEAFQEWVVSEVLPAIRKTGSYINPRSFTKEQMLDVLLNPDFLRALHDVLSRYHAVVAAREVEKAIHKQIVSELQPAKEYLDKILASDCDMTVSQIAADYGLTAIALNKILEENKVQHKVNGQWLLTKEYMKKGYTHSGTTCISLASGDSKVVICTQWTQKGRLFIYNLLKKLGYVPVEDDEGR